MFTLMRIRCGNMEEENKYWVDESSRKCIFYKEELDSIKHYVGEYGVAKDWFAELGDNIEVRYNNIWSDSLDEVKERVIQKLWREKEII